MGRHPDGAERSRGEERDAHAAESRAVGLFAALEAGADVGADLIDPPGARNDRANPQRHTHFQVESRSDRLEVDLRAGILECGQRLEDEIEHRFIEEPADDGADAHPRQRSDEARAKLAQVAGEAHPALGIAASIRQKAQPAEDAPPAARVERPCPCCARLFREQPFRARLLRARLLRAGSVCRHVTLPAARSRSAFTLRFPLCL